MQRVGDLEYAVKIVTIRDEVTYDEVEEFFEEMGFVVNRIDFCKTNSNNHKEEWVGKVRKTYGQKKTAYVYFWLVDTDHEMIKTLFYPNGNGRYGETDENGKIKYPLSYNVGVTKYDNNPWIINENISPMTMDLCVTKFSKNNTYFNKNMEYFNNKKYLLSKMEKYYSPIITNIVNEKDKIIEKLDKENQQLIENIIVRDEEIKEKNFLCDSLQELLNCKEEIINELEKHKSNLTEISSLIMNKYVGTLQEPILHNVENDELIIKKLNEIMYLSTNRMFEIKYCKILSKIVFDNHGEYFLNLIHQHFGIFDNIQEEQLLQNGQSINNVEYQTTIINDVVEELSNLTI